MSLFIVKAPCPMCEKAEAHDGYVAAIMIKPAGQQPAIAISDREADAARIPTEALANAIAAILEGGKVLPFVETESPEVIFDSTRSAG